jgi:regulator of sirC expression with transglutaminase-like and TPR domain
MVRVHDSFLRTARRQEMVIRLLTNLKSLYLNIRDQARALAAVERLLLLRPIAPAEIRDRGVILARLGRRREALEQLEAYLSMAPEASDFQRIQGMVEELRNGEEGDR